MKNFYEKISQFNLVDLAKRVSEDFNIEIGSMAVDNPLRDRSDNFVIEYCECWRYMTDNETQCRRRIRLTYDSKEASFVVRDNIQYSRWENYNFHYTYSEPIYTKWSLNQ